MGLANLNKTNYAFRVLQDRGELEAMATDWIAAHLRGAIADKGKASLALSGGSTPRPIYQALSSVDMPWRQVQATLVDERISDSESGSNGKMVRELLMQNNASHMELIDMSAASDLTNSGFDICIMGMGTDGHTASWFPGSKNLEEALAINTDKSVIEIEAAGCPGAGQYPHRRTFTLPAVMNSGALLLLITGQEKLRVFEAAMMKSVFEAPVKALLAAGERLTVMWAP